MLKSECPNCGRNHRGADFEHTPGPVQIERDDLRDALEQAQNLVEFLHGCLTEPHVDGVPGGYTYAYPEHTLKYLEEWAKLAPRLPYCFHSKTVKGCPSCDAHIARAEARARREELKQKKHLDEMTRAAQDYPGGYR
jgi:hypothetical protein